MPEASTGRPPTPEEGVPPGSRRHARLLPLVPLAATVGVLVVLPPDLLFRDAIPALTDLSGHLLPPTFLATELLPRFQLRGWSMDWFAGFPAYYFYFPLPGLFTAVLGQMVGDGLALRITMALPLVALPWALFAFARWSRLSTAATVGVVLGGSGFLLMSSYLLLGGNIHSTLSGEYHYGWSLALTVLYLGLIVRPASSRHIGTLAGVVLAAATLSHVLPALAACVGLAPFLHRRDHRRTILRSWVVGALLTAFWTVPLVLRLNQVGDAGWTYVPSAADILPLEIILLLPAAAAGGMLARRNMGLALLVSTGVVGILAAALPQTLIMRGRLLPMWFLAVHVLAGAGLAWSWTALRAGRWRRALPVLLVGGAAALLMVAARGIGPWHTGSEDVLRGLAETPGHAELEDLLDRLRTNPPGRVHWERGTALARWGGDPAFSLIPYWTDHTSLGGLWRESSALSPFIRSLDMELSRFERPRPYAAERPPVQWNPPRAVEKLRLLGVRYVITHSKETGVELERLAAGHPDRFGDLRLFDLGEAPLVSTVACVAVAPDDGRFRDHAESWFRAWRPGDPLLVSEPGADLPDGSGCAGGSSETARTVIMDHGHIRFQTEHPGRPHLVRVSYFPNWKAEGARGPHLAAPWFMVVVPEGEVVDLRFRPTAAEWAGWILTLGGVLGIGLTSIGRSEP